MMEVFNTRFEIINSDSSVFKVIQLKSFSIQNIPNWIPTIPWTSILMNQAYLFMAEWWPKLGNRFQGS